MFEMALKVTDNKMLLARTLMAYRIRFLPATAKA